MKVGFLRLGLPIELNLDTASPNTLGTEIRTGLLHDMLEEGHKVTLYTPVKERDALKSKGAWYANLGYDPVGLPKNEDVLIIEMGVANTTFEAEYFGRQINLVERIFECVDAFEGEVIYYQHGCLPFPFGASKNADKTRGPKNLSGLFGLYDMFRHKNWTVWHHFLNEEKAMAAMHYKGFDLNYKFTKLGCSKIDPYLPVDSEKIYDLLWIGSQWDSSSKSAGYERSKEILRFYDITGLNTGIMGKWDAGTMIKHPHVQFLGQVGRHGDAYKYWNMAHACVWTTSKVVQEWGLICTRPLMTIRAGALLLADANIDGVGNVVRPEFHVNGPEGVKRKLEIWKSLGVEEKENVRWSQHAMFPTWRMVIGEVLGDG